MTERANQTRERNALKAAVSEVDAHNADAAGHGPPRSEKAHGEKP